ncbi:ferritin-like domain-containing protein [Myxococcus qinghaiensis]|uniref:ferritin-like domain-containing protein n=1 Tax=Myxococcus qinghaiensis TaxID=2906758 RepID=UPI0020A6ED86|nr:ferritin-like domain-containing protein [Myxococcus qinghaiensis]MCP3166000.1 ferritin-like domain-containing protein [Myxococcus qinghaiensis]
MTEELSRRAALRRATAAASLGLATGLLTRATPALALSPQDDLAPLKALLTAERNAIKTYDAAVSVLDTATPTDPLFPFQGIVKAIALHFRQQHTEHAERLARYITRLAGVDDVGEGTAQVPADFVPGIKNVIDLATNAEKAAAIGYTDAQKSLVLADNAELAAAIGAVESQHFVVLNLAASGFVTPPASTVNQPADALAPVAARFVPRSFAITVDGAPGLDDETDLPFYDVTR